MWHHNFCGSKQCYAGWILSTERWFWIQYPLIPPVPNGFDRNSTIREKQRLEIDLINHFEYFWSITCSVHLYRQIISTANYCWTDHVWLTKRIPSKTYWHLDPRHLKNVYRFLKHLKGTFRLSITVPGPNDVFKATKWQAPLIDLHDWQCGNLPMKCCIATRKHHNKSIEASSILAASARLPDKKLLSGTIRSDDNVSI